MQKTILVILMLCTYMLQAQTKLPDNGIYAKAEDFKTGHLLLPPGRQPVKIRLPVLHSKQVWLQEDDRIYRYHFDTIWGYRRKNCNWRIYDGEAYEIKDTGNICLYELPVIAETGIIPSEYFSTGISGPLKTLNRQHLLEAYYDDTAFVHKVKEVRHAHILFKKDKRTQHYLFEQWLTPP